MIRCRHSSTSVRENFSTFFETETAKGSVGDFPARVAVPTGEIFRVRVGRFFREVPSARHSSLIDSKAGGGKTQWGLGFWPCSPRTGSDGTRVALCDGDVAFLARETQDSPPSGSHFLAFYV